MYDLSKDTNYTTHSWINVSVEPCNVYVNPPPDLGPFSYIIDFDKEPSNLVINISQFHYTTVCPNTNFKFSNPLIFIIEPDKAVSNDETEFF